MPRLGSPSATRPAQILKATQLPNRAEVHAHIANSPVPAQQDERRSGSRSAMAVALLKAQGFKGAINLAGGMIAWKEAFG